MSQPPYQVAPQCYRHPGRVTYVNCQRCGRPICPECMISAPVGFQCPECVAEGMRSTRQNQAPFGGLRSRRPGQASLALIGINVAVWIMLTLTGGASSPLFVRLALLPTGRCVPVDDPGSFFPGMTQAMCEANSGLTQWMPGVDSGAWWQLLTSAFTHLDLIHLGFNMLALWFLGPQLELAIGRARFIALYLVSALAGSALVIWLSDPASATIGASGAVFGLMGALLVLAGKFRGDVQQILLWLGINAAYSLLGSGISWQGHLGGLLGGIAAAAIIVYAPRKNRTQLQRAGLAALTLLILAAIVLRALLPA